MSKVTFWGGMGIGLVAGAALLAMSAPKNKSMKTGVGRTMQQVSHKVDDALGDLKRSVSH